MKKRGKDEEEVRNDSGVHAYGQNYMIEGKFVIFPDLVCPDAGNIKQNQMVSDTLLRVVCDVWMMLH